MSVPKHDTSSAAAASPPTPSSSSSSSGPNGNPTLRSSVKSAVDLTNSALASLEHTTHAASDDLLSRLQSLGRQVRHVAARSIAAYDSRLEYGPQIVAGSAVLLGGLVAMRRGRVPGAVVGLGAGMGAYGGVYGLSSLSSPPFAPAGKTGGEAFRDFPKKEE